MPTDCADATCEAPRCTRLRHKEHRNAANLHVDLQMAPPFAAHARCTCHTESGCCRHPADLLVALWFTARRAWCSFRRLFWHVASGNMSRRSGSTRPRLSLGEHSRGNWGKVAKTAARPARARTRRRRRARALSTALPPTRPKSESAHFAPSGSDPTPLGCQRNP